MPITSSSEAIVELKSPVVRCTGIDGWLWLAAEVHQVPKSSGASIHLGKEHGELHLWHDPENG